MQSHLLSLCFIFSIFSQQLQAYKWDLAVTAIFRDEAPYMKEWIEFHKLIGVQHFYLYNNLSTDGYAEVLAPYINSGEVELIDWPYESKNVGEWDGIQIAAHNHAHKLSIKDKVKWLAVIDLDEFLFSMEGENFLDLLAPYESYAAMYVYWIVFGTSGIAKVPSDRLMIESLTMNGGTNGLFKGIYRPKLIESIGNPHWANIKPGKRASGFNPDRARINHYWGRDEDYFYKKKVPMREKWGGSKASCEAWNAGNNQAPDYTILRFVPELRRRMGFD